MNHRKYSYFLISALFVLILSLSLGAGLFRNKTEERNMENEVEYIKIKQNQTEGYLFENMELNKMIGVDITKEYVRTLDDTIYELDGVNKAFPKVYIYYSSNYCESCVNYVMGKLQQMNDSLGESNISLLFHNYDSRLLYVNKVKQKIKNNIYMVGDFSVIANELDELSKPVILLTDENGVITMAYSPSEDFDDLFNDYLKILKTKISNELQNHV